MRQSPLVRVILTGLFLAALPGCSKEEPIRVYETAAAPRPQTLELPDGCQNWRRVEPDNINLFAFEAGQGGKVVKITIGPSGGGLLANINRWRVQQLKLPAIGEKDLDQQLTPITVDTFRGHYIELSNPVLGEAIYGAIIPAKGRDWFFKLRGPIAVAEREKTNFKAFYEMGVRAIALAVHEPKTEAKSDGQ